MEPISCTTVVIDDSGQIVAFEGADGEFGITNDIAGRDWNQAFASWGLPTHPFVDMPPGPARVTVNGPTSDLIRVEFIPIPRRAGAGEILAVFRTAYGESLSERQQQLCGLGEISAGVAHEVNNALTLVLGWLELLLMDHGDNPELSTTLEVLLGEANRIADLMCNLRDVARGDSSSTSELNMTKLVDDVVTLVHNEMRNSNIDLQRDLADDLPPVQGNVGRLKQAMLNLLLNAREAMPDGGKVVLSLKPDTAGHVNLAVTDNGCGIPQDERGRIFSPFFTTKKDGTGLGLSVTRKIVEEHGGSLKLESRLGKGTRFTLRFPAVKV